VDRVVAVRDGKLASETVRVQKADSGEHHLVELAVLDAVGRLQIPREILEEFGIRRRVLIETTTEGILIRKPNGEHPGVEHNPSSSEKEPAKSEPLHVPSGLSRIWQSITAKFKRGEPE
jgi:hypothetical protein